ncbi:MAG: glutaminyl-peptide cyclotransferase [Myxococcota bacterium]
MYRSASPKERRMWERPLPILAMLLAVACSTPSPASPDTNPVGHPPASKVGPVDIDWEAIDTPLQLSAVVVASYPHDPQAWTQGLVWYDGHLFESVGLRGRSDLRRVALSSGQILERQPLAPHLFGEGLALDGERGRLVQLTFKEETALVWDLDTFRQVETLPFSGEGWGLCFDGQRFILSQGHRRVSLRDRDTFAEIGQTTLQHPAPLPLNALECIEDRVVANIWGSDILVIFDPDTGRVLAWVHTAPLLSPGEAKIANILNGIAFNPERGTLLLTGKWWPRMFEVKLAYR